MRKLGTLAAVLAALAVAAGPARAQRQFGGGLGNDTLSLAAQQSVREDLKLTEEQGKKVEQLAQARRGSFRDLRNLSREERQKNHEEQTRADEKALAGILDAGQLKRLKQIALQQQGARALADPAVADALKLTDKQRGKARAIREDLARGTGNGFRRGGAGNREEARKKAEEARKAADEKLMNLLTAEQKAKWKELTGEPFKGELRRPDFRGRGRPGRGGSAPGKP
jgi:Spy/CpxP family protein refolding chaperone